MLSPVQAAYMEADRRACAAAVAEHGDEDMQAQYLASVLSERLACLAATAEPGWRQQEQSGATQLAAFLRRRGLPANVCP